MLGHVVSCWGVSKHVELCLWALSLLYSVLQPGLFHPPFPLSSQLPVLLAPFLLCWAWRGNADS